MTKNRTMLALALLAGTAAAAEFPDRCTEQQDDRERLACYDSAYKRTRAGSQPGVDPPVATSDRERNSSPMSKAWELGLSDKRNTFVVRTYLPNFLLPLHYTSSLNRSPSSPTHPASTNTADYSPIEAKLQISLRAKIVEDLLLPGADLWAAYTQRSLWQLWDAGDSSPFRSTDYQPELIYVIPVPEKIGTLPMGWKLRMLQLGFAHQSNGQSDPFSRSWNRITFGAGFERDELSVNLRANQRVRLQGKDDNPDLAEYVGRGELNIEWAPGPTNFSLTWRTNFKAASRGSLQMDVSYPVFATQPAGLRWYVQLFHGYGETLIDYNHRQTSLGLGLTLFQF